MSDIKYIDGLIVKAPHERAPEYVKAKLSIKRQELIGWLQQQSGDWINADIKVTQGGKWYVAIDDWKPNQGSGNTRTNAPRQQRQAQPEANEYGNDFDDDDLPFN